MTTNAELWLLTVEQRIPNRAPATRSIPQTAAAGAFSSITSENFIHLDLGEAEDIRRQNNRRVKLFPLRIMISIRDINSDELLVV